MNKFVEFEIELYDSEKKDMGMKSDLFPAKVFIDLFQVSAFREHSRDGEKDLSLLLVYLSNGDSFPIINCTYAKFKRMIQEAGSNIFVQN